ncbi:hypothetical protein CSB37_02095 [bacterium DOLZORAL124_38_8]|nr:MAG: hypothetical protein CSB37_02095 [bacterium DOLZORAL124_38_8]
MTKNNHFIYILTNKNHTTFYVGRTIDLIQRIYTHRQKLVEGFTKKYNLTKLVYFESGGDFESSLARERKIKKYCRAWKKNLIESINPEWKDLYNLITKT